MTMLANKNMLKLYCMEFFLFHLDRVTCEFSYDYGVRKNYLFQWQLFDISSSFPNPKG
jgi:hypothetical protein